MNEEFIKQFRKSPDLQMVEKIHARLERRERVQTLKKYSVRSGFALLLVFGMLVLFSSTARADVLRFIENVAGLRFEVASNYPGTGEEIIIDSDPVSLEEAQSRFESPIALPTYVPQGYGRNANVIFHAFSNQPVLTVIWENHEKGSSILLDIQNCSPQLVGSCELIVGENALEEITLNGKPAVAVHGAWNYDTQQYDTSTTTAIQWAYDQSTIYTLTSGNKNLSLEELIKMAESIP